MDYTLTILTINSSSIVILLLLAFILLLATRFRGENGYAAAIIVLPNVPVYFYNMSRMLGWYEVSLFMFPISFSVNTLLMPLLWLFTLKNFSPDFRMRWRDLLHFLPAVVFLIISIVISEAEVLQNIQSEASGEDGWVGNLNTIIVFLQMVGYYIAIFVYIFRRKRTIAQTSSDAEWVQKEWILHFQILFALLFVVVMVSYAIWPRTDAWLIQILNVIAMAYLVYNSIAHPVVLPSKVDGAINEYVERVDDRLVDENKTTIAVPEISQEQMSDICEQAVKYLTDSKAYLDNNLTLAKLAQDIGVGQRLLSRSINTLRNQNFFEFINEMRVEEAKRLLLDTETSGYSIDSVYTECGFRSRSTFFLVFKKITNTTPSQWLKNKLAEN